MLVRGGNMRDFPKFPMEYGTVGLVLNQIPYTGNAYIRVHEVIDLQLLLEECADFCAAAGAEHIYACGSCDFSSWGAGVAILKMQCPIREIGETDACLMPITEETVGSWLQIHNRAMEPVDHAAYLDSTEGRKLLRDGGGYFVHRNGELLGIGIASGGEISALVAVKKGAGADVLLALCHALSEETVYLEVAETNEKAISLYNRLGFLQTGVKCVWHKIH